MKKHLLLFVGLLSCLQLCAQRVLVNGVPWYDDRDSIVSAHGGNIIYNEDAGTFYLYGEYKTDSANVFNGFSCYSSKNMVNWKWEGLALPPQKAGRMSSTEVGEHPKVLRCPLSGEYVMLMCSDNINYTEPCVLYATSKTPVGPFVLQGPLLYQNKPIQKWDIGVFVDDDGKAYLLDQFGEIYRLSYNFHSVMEKICDAVQGVGESPAMIRMGGYYYWLSSQTTSWESNDNTYLTATDIHGPWMPRGTFAKKGTMTYNSQVSNVFMVNYEGTKTPMFMGDRWSYPRQHSSATYVWLPLRADAEKLTIPSYWQCIDPLYGTKSDIGGLGRVDSISCQTVLHEAGQEFNINQKIKENARLAIYGKTGPDGGYGEITLLQEDGWKEVHATVNFYSKVPSEGLLYISSKLPKGMYKITIHNSQMNSHWTDKSKVAYGSTGHTVDVETLYVINE